MGRRIKDWSLWIVILVILAGLAILVWAIITNSRNILEAFGWITGAVIPATIFIFDQLHKRNLRLFLFTNKLRSLLSKRAPTWNLSVLMQGEQVTEKSIDQITKKLLELRSDTSDTKVMRFDANSSTVYIRSLPPIEITFTPTMQSPIPELGDKEFPSIKISMRSFRVGYAQSSVAIQDDISPILESIAGTIQDTETRYSLVIDFDKDKNPFYGLYIANLPPETISKFSILLVFNNQGQKDTVAISESKVAINARTQTALKRLALNFLTFDPKLEGLLRHA